jgi:two-component system sensor kinase FixL
MQASHRMSGVKQESAENLFEVLMDAAVDAIIIIDEKGGILRFNRSAQRMFGYTADYVRGSNVSLLMPEPDRSRHDDYLASYLTGGDAKIIGIGRQVSGLRSNGLVFPMHLSVGEVKMNDGRSQYVGIIRDLSEQKAAEDQVYQLEEQLVHADRLVILGELTAGIAHEINQPLTAIAAYADAGKHLVERSDDTRPQDIHVICERIGEQSRRAAEVVQRLRTMVRTGTVSKARHDLNIIITNTLLLFEYELNKSGIELEFFPAEKLQDLYVDEIQIQQILVNLVKNSLDAISAAGQSDGRIEIVVNSVGKEVLVAVQDNGPGVSTELRRRLFESFFTTKPKGVGLGLSICKNIAAAHGGSLSYRTPARGGSCFTLRLPLEHIG